MHAAQTIKLEIFCILTVNRSILSKENLFVSEHITFKLMQSLKIDLKNRTTTLKAENVARKKKLQKP